MSCAPGSAALAPIGWTALVLAGGRGSRLGGEDKAAITIDGTSTLDHLLACLPELVPVVVAGPVCRTRRPVTFAGEWPRHGGPVAGVAAGLAAVSTPVTALLAVDMPWAGVLVGHLVAEFASCQRAALVPVDGSGFRQPLCAVVSTDAMRAALHGLGDPAGRSLRDLFSHIDVRERPLRRSEMGWVQDIDTPADLRRARSRQALLSVASPAAPGRESTTKEFTTQEPSTQEPSTQESSTQESSAHEQGDQPMKTWINAVCTQLNLPADVNVDVVLDVARVSAHSVQRPAAPVTTFLLGVAVAGGMDVNEAAAKISQLAATWPAPTE